MTDSGSAQCDALPEGRWLWRRLHVFLSSALAWLMLDGLLGRAPADQTARLAEGLMLLLGLTMVIYLVAPTTQQLFSAVTAYKAGR